MFGIAPTELLLVALVALLVIGPKDMPKAMRVLGRWISRARGMARHFQAGLDEMVRQAELEEMEKKWRAENERIMHEHPSEDPGQSAPEDVDTVGGDASKASHPPDSSAPGGRVTTDSSTPRS